MPHSCQRLFFTSGLGIKSWPTSICPRGLLAACLLFVIQQVAKLPKKKSLKGFARWAREEAKDGGQTLFRKRFLMTCQKVWSCSKKARLLMHKLSPANPAFVAMMFCHTQVLCFLARWHHFEPISNLNVNLRRKRYCLCFGCCSVCRSLRWLHCSWCSFQDSFRGVRCLWMVEKDIRD